MFHGFDESFIRGRLQRSAGEFNVGFVASHGHAGSGTKTTRNNQNRFEIDNFRNDIDYVKIKWHGCFSSSCPYSLKP
jgi:hypothetical protein